MQILLLLLLFMPLQEPPANPEQKPAASADPAASEAKAAPEGAPKEGEAAAAEKAAAPEGQADAKAEKEPKAAAPAEAKAPAEAEAVAAEGAEKAEPVAVRDDLVPIDPDDGRVHFFDPDIRLGSIIAHDIPITQLLREVSREKKVNLAVDNAVTDSVTLDLARADTTLNELLNILVHLFPITCERVGGFVYIRPSDDAVNRPTQNEIVFNQNNEEISFNLTGMRLEDFARDLIEITGKNVLFPREAASPDTIIKGYQARLPFVKGLSTLLDANGLGLREEEGIYYIGLIQGVRLRGDLIDIWFESAPLKDVLHKLADISAFQIMLVDKLEGEVSIDVKGVTIDQLLKLLSGSAKFSYNYQDGVYLVGKNNSSLLFETVTVAFDQIHAEIVQGMLPQPMTEGVTVVLLKELNSLLFSGERTKVRVLESIARNLDRRVAQVLLEVIMVRYDVNDTLNIGVTATAGDGSELFPNINLGFDGYRDEHGSYKITKLPSSFSLMLNALQKKGKAKVITKPHIATLSGNQAELKIGTNLYYRLNSEELVGNDNPRVRTAQKIDSVEALTSLKITPWVMGQDLLTVDITSTFNSFGGAVVDNVPPSKSINSITSTVRLRDGETIILGGLIIDEQSLTHEGVPFLSRVPLLGALFRNKDKATTLNETVIYITPHIYYGDEGSEEFIADKSVLDYRLQKKWRHIPKKRKTRQHRLKKTPDTMQQVLPHENPQRSNQKVRYIMASERRVGDARAAKEKTPITVAKTDKKKNKKKAIETRVAKSEPPSMKVAPAPPTESLTPGTGQTGIGGRWLAMTRATGAATQWHKTVLPANSRWAIMLGEIDKTRAPGMLDPTALQADNERRNGTVHSAPTGQDSMPGRWRVLFNTVATEPKKAPEPKRSVAGQPAGPPDPDTDDRSTPPPVLQNRSPSSRTPGALETDQMLARSEIAPLTLPPREPLKKPQASRTHDPVQTREHTRVLAEMVARQEHLAEHRALDPAARHDRFIAMSQAETGEVLPRQEVKPVTPIHPELDRAEEAAVPQVSTNQLQPGPELQMMTASTKTEEVPSIQSIPSIPPGRAELDHLAVAVPDLPAAVPPPVFETAVAEADSQTGEPVLTLLVLDQEHFAHLKKEGQQAETSEAETLPEQPVEPAPEPETRAMPAQSANAIDRVADVVPVPDTSVVRFNESRYPAPEPLPMPEPLPADDWEVQEDDPYKLMSDAVIEELRAVEARYAIAYLMLCKDHSLERYFETHAEYGLKILPKKINEQDCYIFIWGAYDSAMDARDGMRRFPKDLRIPGERPWIINLKKHLNPPSDKETTP